MRLRNCPDTLEPISESKRNTRENRRLVGRTEETRAIADVVRTTATGGQGRLLIIRGAPGAGKSALLDLLLREVEKQTPTTRLTCSPSDLELDYPDEGDLPGEAGRFGIGVDDANWAGETFRAWAAIKARAIEASGSLLALVDRSEEASGWIRELERLPGVVKIEPGALNPGDCAEIAGGLEEDPEGVKAMRETAGNPRLLTHYLSEGESGEPDTDLLDWVSHRLGRLEPGARAVAEAMAILGSSGTLAETEEVTGLGTSGALAAIDALERADFLERSSPPVLGPPLLRTAVRKTIPAGRRIRLQLAAAEATRRRDERIAASHLIEARPAGPSPESWVVPLLQGAAVKTRNAGQTGDSILVFRRLLEEQLSDEERFEALSALGEMEAERRDPAAVDHLAEASELASDPLVRGRLALVRGRALFHLIALEECSTVCRAAMADLPQEERELKLTLEATALDADALRGVRREHPAELREQVEAGATPGERLVLTHVLADQAATGSAPASEIREAGRRMIASGDLLAEFGANSPTYIYLGTALSWASAYEDVLKLTSEGLRRGKRDGLPAAVSYSAALRAGCALLAGDLDLAEADSSLVVDELADADAMSFAVALAWHLEVLVHRGRLGEARRRLEASGLTGELPELGTIDFLMLARGALAQAEGDDDRALHEFEEVGRRATRAKYLNPGAMDWRSRAALIRLRQGDIKRAQELAEDELERAEAFGSARARGVALVAAGTVAGGESGIAMLERAVELLEPETPVEYARSVVALGEELHRTGSERARGVLYDGLAAAHESGSSLLGERALVSLRATGAKPRRKAVSGIDALTRQERRVAEMAASGLGNREIANRLYLTRRTVEMHLSNAYRKLGIRSRKELPDLIQSSSP